MSMSSTLVQEDQALPAVAHEADGTTWTLVHVGERYMVVAADCLCGDFSCGWSMALPVRDAYRFAGPGVES